MQRSPADTAGLDLVVSSLNNSYVVIFNRRALAARALRRNGLEEALRERRLSYEFVESSTAIEAQAIAEEAARAGRTVVAAGGDGTARDVLNGVLSAERSDSVMGLIPLGTGNDFARALGRVGKGLDKALDALADPQIVSIDVARVNNEEYFVNVLGIGFDAEVSRRSSAKRFRLPGYFPSVLRAMAYYRAQHYRVQSSGGSIEGNAFMIAAMNGSCEGGGFVLAPDARLEDGLLDLYWIDPISLWQFARYVWAVRWGTHGNLPVVKQLRVDHLTVESDKKLQYHVDGEYRELPIGGKLEIRLHPRRLKVIT